MSMQHHFSQTEYKIRQCHPPRTGNGLMPCTKHPQLVSNKNGVTYDEHPYKSTSKTFTITVVLCIQNSASSTQAPPAKNTQQAAYSY